MKFGWKEKPEVNVALYETLVHSESRSVSQQRRISPVPRTVAVTSYSPHVPV